MYLLKMWIMNKICHNIHIIDRFSITRMVGNLG